MDTLTESMSPGVIAILVTLGLAAVGFVVWLVRLEGKTNGNSKEITDLQADHAKEISDLKKWHSDDLTVLREDVKDTRERLFKHVADVSVHHNSEAVQEFRIALERRFTGMEGSLADISRKLNHMAGRE
jgi:hypothetical protein